MTTSFVPEWWEAPPTAAMLHAAATHLVSLFDLRACRFEPFPFDEQLPRIERGRIVLPAAEPGVAPWSGADGVELPVRHAGLTLGRFVLVPATPTTGVGFSAAVRADAIEFAAELSLPIAEALVSGPVPHHVAEAPDAGDREPGRQESTP